MDVQATNIGRIMCKATASPCFIVKISVIGGATMDHETDTSTHTNTRVKIP